MKNKKIDLQFFAGQDDSSNDDGQNVNNQDTAKQFTQEELDKILNDRLARQKSKLEKEFSKKQTQQTEPQKEETINSNSGNNDQGQTNSSVEQMLQKFEATLKMNETLANEVNALKTNSKLSNYVSQGYTEESARKIINLENSLDDESLEIVKKTFKTNDTAIKSKSVVTNVNNKLKDLEQQEQDILKELGFIK